MRNSNQFKNLVRELGRDPRLKRVIAKVKRHSRKKNAAKVESFADFFLLSLAIVSRFVSKKKARSLDELMDVVYLLLQISLLLRENIFDRPEVKEFVSQRSKKMYLVAQKYVDLILSKTRDIDAFKFRRA